MKKRKKVLIAASTAAIAGLAVGSLTAGTGHQVSPAKTITVKVVGSKLSSAGGGGVLAGRMLKARSLNVAFQCPAGTTLTRGRISTAAGSSGWRAPSKLGCRGMVKNRIRFSNVPLANNQTLRTMCPVNKKGSAFKEVTLELTAECSSRQGTKQKPSNQFPQMMRLDCDQIEVDSKVAGNTFWHTCPTGYVMKHNRGTSRESTTMGWGNPRNCVRKK